MNIDRHSYVSYWELSRRPLQSLVFLLPLIIIYEIGVFFWTLDPVTGTPQHISARALLHKALAFLGAPGYFLPGLLVIVILLSVHIAGKYKWRVDTATAFKMLAESFGLSIPLLMMAFVMFRGSSPVVPAAQATTSTATQGQLGQEVIFSIGAGIYEEIVFRVIGIALLHTLFKDMLRVPEEWAVWATVIITAFAFAHYHFPNGVPNHLPYYAFLVLAGIYLAWIYIGRGFGIVAGTHAIYDVIVAASNLGLFARIWNGMFH